MQSHRESKRLHGLIIAPLWNVLLVLGILVIILILTLDVAVLALYLKRANRPYSRTWCMRFVQAVEVLRESCYLLLIVLVCAAFLLVFSMLLGWSDHHMIAL